MCGLAVTRRAMRNKKNNQPHRHRYVAQLYQFPEVSCSTRDRKLVAFLANDELPVSHVYAIIDVFKYKEHLEREDDGHVYTVAKHKYNSSIIVAAGRASIYQLLLKVEGINI